MGWEVGISLFDIFNKYLNVSSIVLLGFPGGPDGKECVCNWENPGSIPWLGRSPGEGKGYTLNYSGLENSMDCVVHGSQRVGHD